MKLTKVAPSITANPRLKQLISGAKNDWDVDILQHNSFCHVLICRLKATFEDDLPNRSLVCS